MKTSGTSGSSSNKRRQSKDKTTTPGGESILEGLQEGFAHLRGEIQLRSRVVYIPDDVDVHAVREASG